MKKGFNPAYTPFDIVMIITALPFDFTTKNEVTTEKTFTNAEIESIGETNAILPEAHRYQTAI